MNYTPESLILEDEKDLRREYTRYRDIAQKRLKRLRNEGFGKSQIAQAFGGEDVPKLSTLKTKEDIVFALTTLKGFIDAKQSTVKGMRKYIKEEREKANKIDKKLAETIATLNKRFPEGNKFHKDNIQNFFDFMNNRVTQEIEKIVSSDRIALLYKIAESKKITDMKQLLKSEKELLFFINNLENLEVAELPRGKYKSAKAYKAWIESEINHGRDRSELYKSKYYEDNRGAKATNKRGRARKKH